MSVRSRLEGAALVLAALAVAAFLASAGVGLRFRSPAPPTDTTPPILPAEDAPAPRPEAPGGAPVRVEVLNGTTRAGLALSATEQLRAAGFDVVFFGNAGERRALSVVLDRRDRAEAARAVAAALGIGAVREVPDSTRYVDATVVLGADWPPAPIAAREAWTARLWHAIRSAF